MIEDIRWAKIREGDVNLIVVVSPGNVYKLQVLVDGVWLDLPKPDDLEMESK